MLGDQFALIKGKAVEGTLFSGRPVSTVFNYINTDFDISHPLSTKAKGYLTSGDE